MLLHLRPILTLWFVAIFVCSASAQFDDYWGIAGGNLRLDYEDNGITTFTDISFSPQVGLFLSEELLLGVGINIGTTIIQDKKRTEDRFSSSVTGWSAFMQYYFSDNKRFHFYAQPELYLSKIFRTDDAIGLGSTGDLINYFRGSIGVGATYFVNKNIALNGLVNVSILEQWTSAGQSFPTSLRPELRLGLQFFASKYNAKKSNRKKKEQQAVLNAETWVFGGGVSLQNRILSDTLLFISPTVAYFNANRLAFGLGFSGVYNLGNKTNQFEVYPFLRYHLPFSTNYFFIEAGAGLRNRKVEVDPALYNGKEFNSVAEVFGEGKLGLGIFISKFTAMHGGIRYRYAVPFDESEGAPTYKTTIGVEIGIQYFFQRDLSKYDLPENKSSKR